jgi:hypothetical protein
MSTKKYRILPGASFRMPDGRVQDSGTIELDDETLQLHAGKVDPTPVEPPDEAAVDGDV